MTGSDIVKRFDNMDKEFANWQPLLQECADWVMPTNANINHIRVSGLEENPQRMIDIGIEANFNFATGIFSHMFPPNTVWAKYRHPMPEMMAKASVADWYEESSRIIHSTLVASNFAQEEFQSLLCIGCFGTSDMSIEEDDRNVVRFRNFVISGIRIAQNYLGYIDTVGREFKLNPRQAIQQFGEEALRKAELDIILVEADSDRQPEYTFIHFVCPRADYDMEMKDKKNKPWASFYVSRDNKQIVSESGFDYMPHKVARFMVGDGEVYGRSPASMKLATLRRGNVIHRAVTVAAERNTKERWAVPDDDAMAVKSITSRQAIIKYRASSPGGGPEPIKSAADPRVGIEMLELLNDEVKRAFFNHLFRPLEDYRNMTAFEVNERMTSDLMTLAPFVSRYVDEKISPMMEQVFYIHQKRGLLPPMPQELIDSPEYEIDYVGRLSLATKNFEVLGAMDTARLFLEFAASDPSGQAAEALDFINWPKMLVESWYSKSSSMNALRDEKEVKEIQEDRMAAQQNQQMIDNMAPVADAMQKSSGKVDPSSLVAQLQGE